MMDTMEDEVVISGIGGQFAECDNLQEYREKLLQNLHLITDNAGELQPRYTAESAPVDAGTNINLDNVKSGKMRYADRFDNTFFGMHSKLAMATDPITRRTLEATMEAIMDAGYSPKDLRGTNTAVFMGHHINEMDSEDFFRDDRDGFGIMGINAAMASNRVSYWLDLKGSSYTQNTQMVSGLQVLAMAFHAVSRGECERAIVGAASLSDRRELTAQYERLGWLSPSGSCKPFDVAADGGVRGGAVVVLVLERRRTANRVYAGVVHAATGICTEPSRSDLPDIERGVLAQMLREFYKDCGVNPDHIAYLEADGWGLGNMDKAELDALDDALASRRKHPLLVGSVKGNIGHTESASGLASICKAVVAMESGTIPATLNHVRANPKIEGLQQGRIKVVTENTPLAPGMVAVNNFGLGGIMGHVLLRPNQKKALAAPSAPATAEEGPIPKLMLMSGRTQEGLEEVMKLAEANSTDPEYVHLVHRVFSSHIFGHIYRGYSIVPKADKERPAQVKFYQGQKRPVWFVYSGMGSQWPGMGADLMNIPVFAAAIERCHATLLPLGVDLKHIITTKDAAIFDNILHSFVGIAAVQIGLTDVLRAVGVEADGMVGHSVGELGCAYADGCITAEQMILAAHARGQATNETKLIPGKMAAVGLGYKDIKAMLPESIEVACHNSATSCTLSGPAADLDAFVTVLTGKGIFARAVNVANIAYHSRYIRPAAPRLLQLLQGVLLEPKKRSSRWLSTSVLPAQASSYDTEYASPQYFTNNLLSSVYFEEACDQVDKDALAIEIAPHGLLQAILKRSLDKDAVNVALTKRDCPGASMVLEALGKLHMEGLNLDVAKLYPAVDIPVSRDTAPLSPLATWDHRQSWANPYEHERKSGPIIELFLPLSQSTAELRHLVDCTWNGHTLLSPATCLALILSIASNRAPEGRPIVLDNIVFYDPVVLPEQAGDKEVLVMVQRGSGRFEVSVQGQMACSGRSLYIGELDEAPLAPDAVVSEEDRTPYDADAIYEELGRRGLQCRGPFRSLVSLERGARFVLGFAACREDDNESRLELVRALQLETLLQVVALQQSESRHELHVPKRIQKIVFDPSKALPDGSQDTLHYDLDRSCVTLRSPRGRVDMLEVDTQAMPLPPTFAPILVQTQSFLAYEKGAAEDLEHLCSLALQVAALQGRVPVRVAAVGAGALLDIVTKTAKQQLPDLHVNVASLAEAGDDAALVLSDAASLPAALAAVRRQRGLLLAELPPGFTTPAGLHPLLSVELDRRRYALLKHVVDVNPESEVLHVTGHDLPLERLSEAQSAEVYILFRGQSPLAVPGILRALAAAPGGSRAHCVFLQDADAPPFALDAAPYAAHLRLGLRANMLQGGRWGWAHRLHLAHLDAKAAPRLQRTRQLHMDGLKVACLGLNPYSEVAEDGRTAVGLLDYAGVRADGARVMGVCASSAGPLQPDDALVWPVPPAWTDEAAATVPLVYALAVCAVQEKLQARRGERALVVDAATPLGQAATAMLLRAGCRVVAAVKDLHEEASLRASFPNAKFDTVVGTTGSMELLPRRFGAKRCMDVILSQGSPAAYKAALSLVTLKGRAVHVGSDLSVMGKSVGLYTFVDGFVAAFSLSWDWPLHARADAKLRVRDTVLAAIKDGTVQPLPCITTPPNTPAELQRRVAKSAGKVVVAMNLQSDTRTTPVLEANRSCLLLGPAAKAVTLAEWLLSAGARDVSVSPCPASPGCAPGAWVSRRLHQLALHYGASTRLLPTGNPQQLVQAAGQQLPLGLVLALDQPAARVQVLDAALRAPDCVLAVLTDDEAAHELGDVLRSRKQAGHLGVVASVRGLHADVRAVPMHQLLRCAREPAVHTVEVTQVAAGAGLDGEDSVGAAALSRDPLSDMLPSSVEALRRLGQSLQDNVTQRVLPTLIGGLPERRNKEVPPVFLVAGLGDSATRELSPVARFIHSTAVVVAPPCGTSSVEEAAAAVAEAVVRAQPRGPYTVGGRGWGGCVALEAARVLAQSRGCYVTAFLLDASPDAMQAALKPLKNQPAGLPTALLKYLLKLDREVEERVCRTAGWPAQMRVALGRGDAELEAALDCVLRRVKGLIDYDPARLGPVDPKVAVTFISAQPQHLRSAAVSEVVSEIHTCALQALQAAAEDADAVHRQCGTAISAGIHVGRTNMLNQGSLASLSVST